jgi:hypothetical protein
MMGRGHGGQERELLVHGSHDGYFNIKTFRKLNSSAPAGAARQAAAWLCVTQAKENGVNLSVRGYKKTKVAGYLGTGMKVGDLGGVSWGG